jgi:hypothetical protein
MLSSERKRHERHVSRLEAGDDRMRGHTRTLVQAAESLDTIDAIRPPAE